MSDLFQYLTREIVQTSRIRTLTECFLLASRAGGGIRYVTGWSDSTDLSCADLVIRARRVLSDLQARGVRRGDSLIITVEEVPAFVETFWGCILGGVLAVPLVPPTNTETALKVLQVAQQHPQCWLIRDIEVEERLAEAGAAEPDLRAVLARLAPRILDHRAVAAEGPLADIVQAAPDDLAFLQYSSGSTGSPKGVMLTQANIAANVAGLMRIQGPEALRRSINWMPLTHDLGMILYHITPLVTGQYQCQIPSRLFLRSPTIWLEAASRFGATGLGGPNFGFRHVLKTYKPDKDYGWDLSSVVSLINAAEPIDADLMREFMRAMAPHGLRPEAMSPSYGLAEATVGVSITPPLTGPRTLVLDRRSLSVGDRIQPLDDPASPERLEIAVVGDPFFNVEVRIVGEDGEPLPAETVGRLLIRGPSVTQGYFANPEATAKVMMGEGWLDTGDLGFLTAEGRVVITGRMKDIIIINGVNYYPYDIERVAAQADKLDLNMVAACAVPASDGRREALALFIIHRKGIADFARIARQARDLVTRDMGIAVDYCVAVPRLPKTTSGKIRRFLLAEQFASGAFDDQLKELAAALADEFAPLRHAWLSGEPARLAAALAEEAGRMVAGGTVDPAAGLMDQGFTSLRMVELVNRVNLALGLTLTGSFFFDHPSFAAAAPVLQALRPADGDAATPAGETAAVPPAPAEVAAPAPHRQAGSGRIAVIGLGCRFPGAPDAKSYWRLLEEGRDALAPVPAERGWRLTLDRSRVRPGTAVTDRGAWLSDLDRFDAALFGISPGEAGALDPQQRLLLEVSWTALEDAALDPRGLNGQPVGVFVGISGTDWQQHQLYGDGPEQIGPYAVSGATACTASGRISFALGLHGPNLAVDTACSSSLVAVHLAMRALRDGDCGLALAGGVNLMLSPNLHIALSAMGALSPDGQCRSFDASANGYARGEGCGMLVLKRLEDALAEGDPIHAVLDGSAINHDGASAALTAPNGEAQQAVLRAALADAGWPAASVDYVEAHGTGTPLGDPIEAEALGAVFAAGRPAGHPLRLGSAKSNIGHLESAAGIAGLIKIILALRHRRLPASLHLRQPSPRIPWDRLPLRPLAAGEDWAAGTEGPRRAGVSSFGISGTNAHILVSEAPPRAENHEEEDRAAAGLPQIALVSAPDPAGLAAAAGRWSAACRAAAGPAAAADLARSSACRPVAGLRLFAVGTDGAALAEGLDAAARDIPPPVGTAPSLLLAFPGQGTQGKLDLRPALPRLPVLRDSLAEADGALSGLLPAPLADLLAEGSEAQLAASALAQPLVLAVGVGLARQLQAFGLRPAGAIGHSVGEVTAAVVAGHLDFAQALRFVQERGRLMDGLAQKGGMLAVAATPAQLSGLLEREPGVVIAAYNGPQSVTLAGDQSALARLARLCEGQGLRARALRVAAAFHSPLMEPILPALDAAAAGLTAGEASLPVYSTLSGRRLQAADLGAAGHWSRHARQPVRFADALQAVPPAEGDIVVELGVSPALVQIGPLNRPDSRWLSAFGQNGPAESGLLTLLGQLWQAGTPVAWDTVFASRPGRRVHAPTRVFRDSRFPLPLLSGAHRTVSSPSAVSPQAVPPQAAAPSSLPATASLPPAEPRQAPRKDPMIQQRLNRIVEKVVGIAPEALDLDANWFALGMDSLMIVQMQQALTREFAAAPALAEIYSHGPTPRALAELLAALAAPEAAPEAPPIPAPQTAALAATLAAPAAVATAIASPAGDPADATVESVLTRQIDAMQRLFAQQMDLLRGMPAQPAPALPASPQPAPARPAAAAPVAAAAPAAAPAKRNHEIKGLFRQPLTSGGTFTPAQAGHAEKTAAAWSAHTPRSKALAQRDRPHLANPRSVIGFRPEWKEMIYPLSASRAEGAYVWDLDGHRYVDVTGAFGAALFGHDPDFVREALTAEIATGWPVGPHRERNGRVAEKICAMTGVERVAFFTTGSEATMVAIRLARAVTGRPRIALFTGAYHGTFDGLLATGWADEDGFTTMPMTDGTPPDMVKDVMVLRYGDPKSLDAVRRHAHELAAVICEPVQSRNPQNQPVDFVRELRAVTAERDIALILDEVITGFRMHPGGIQALWDVRADLVTYGKVLGGGMPIGAVAGRRRFLDAVDGGPWGYGDDSLPTTRTAFVAGTFNQHPLTMAAAEAVLDRLAEEGPALQERVGHLTADLCGRLDGLFADHGVPIRMGHFGSLFRFDYQDGSELLNYHLLRRGIFVWEGRNCFLSAAHTPADVDFIVEAVRGGVEDMLADGWFAETPAGGR